MGRLKRSVGRRGSLALAAVGILVGTFAFATAPSAASTGQLPGGWTDVDVGSPAPAGSASDISETSGAPFTVSGAGSDIWGTSDQFNYVYLPTVANATIMTQITSVTDTSSNAKAGIMFKESAVAGAPYFLLAVSPSGDVKVQYDFNASIDLGTYTMPNLWLMITRGGDTFTAYLSSDGDDWTQVFHKTLAISSDATMGFFESSHKTGVLGTATFQNERWSIVPPPGPPPSFWADTDLGSPALPGSAVATYGVPFCTAFHGCSRPVTFTVSGAGSDIWGSSDQFNYLNQQPSIPYGNCFQTQVTSVTDTSPDAKAGIMFKQSATAGAPYFLLAVSPSGDVKVQYDFNASIDLGTYTMPNLWLNMCFESGYPTANGTSPGGGTFYASVSSDGVTWGPVFHKSLAITGPATLGLFECSHNPSEVGTATFTNVTLNGGIVGVED